MKKIITSIVLIFLGVVAYAQQDAQFTQYIFNELIINPAYAGSKEMHTINATYAAQWAGFTGAPNTATLSYDGPIYKNMGLGVHFINDMIGAQMQQGLFASYAYKIRLNEKWRLALGLAAGVSYFTLNGAKLISDIPDPDLTTDKVTQLNFDSKTGLFLNNDRFYAGFSITNLLGDVIKSKDPMVTNPSRHYYLTTGYVFDLGKKFKFKPSFLIKEDFKSPTNIDINAFFLYKEKIWLGASYRMNTKIGKKSLVDDLHLKNAVAIMAEWNITDRLRIGYAYTLTLTALKNYSGHEVQIGYFFPTKVIPMMKTPRFF